MDQRRGKAGGVDLPGLCLRLGRLGCRHHRLYDHLGLPAISEIGLGNFLFGTEWKPKSGIFGIPAADFSSIAGTFGAILIGVPRRHPDRYFFSLRSLGRVSPRWCVRRCSCLREFPRSSTASSGMLVIVPAIRAVFPQSIGDSLLAVILILAVMVLPYHHQCGRDLTQGGALLLP